MIRSFQDYGLNVSVYDPWADPVEVFDTYAIHSTSKLPNTQYDAIVHAVAHTDFLQIDINTLKKSTAIIYDVKSVLPITVDGRL
jgi:UDP-N-acetyl-D-glucosamine/UDP-N-acetyl-D-galactosamine dehydrogenase